MGTSSEIERDKILDERNHFMEHEHLAPGRGFMHHHDGQGRNRFESMHGPNNPFARLRDFRP